MFEVWLQMSDTNIDTENPSDLPALVNCNWKKKCSIWNKSIFFFYFSVLRENIAFAAVIMNFYMTSFATEVKTQTYAVITYLLLYRVLTKILNNINQENSLRDAHTPRPGEIVFNTTRYRSSETVKTGILLAQCHLYKGPHNV